MRKGENNEQSWPAFRFYLKFQPGKRGGGHRGKCRANHGRARLAVEKRSHRLATSVNRRVGNVGQAVVRGNPKGGKRRSGPGAT